MATFMDELRKKTRAVEVFEGERARFFDGMRQKTYDDLVDDARLGLAGTDLLWKAASDLKNEAGAHRQLADVSIGAARTLMKKAVELEQVAMGIERRRS